jgi:hypothetical protein
MGCALVEPGHTLPAQQGWYAPPQATQLRPVQTLLEETQWLPAQQG